MYNIKKIATEQILRRQLSRLACLASSLNRINIIEILLSLAKGLDSIDVKGFIYYYFIYYFIILLFFTIIKII